MPFAPGGAVGSGLGMATLHVEPDQVLRLRNRLAAVRDRVENFLRDKAEALNVRPLGADPVSAETAQAFNENAQAAIDAASGFVDELNRVLGSLDQAAKAYNLVENTHAQAYRLAGQ
jgi:hypothetical protein